MLKPKHVIVVASLLVAGCYDGATMAGGDTDGGTAAQDGSGDPSEGDESGGEEPPAEANLVPQSVSRRLSQAELDNTLRDLMADETRPARGFLSEDEFAPYDNDYGLQVASRALIESMEVLAIDVANRLVQDPARRGLVVPCTPAADDDAACFDDFVRSFGRLVLRRPLTEEEVGNYAVFLPFATEDVPGVDNDFYTAVALAVSAFVQDPEFLYRIEAGVPTTEPGVFKLNDYEIATRVSFLLWGTGPDDALIADAEAGRLSDVTDRTDVVDRLLLDDRAKQQLHRYHAMWLGYRAIPHDATLNEAFNAETTALIDRVVFEERDAYSALFTAEETYIDAFLAEHYGLEAPASGEDWVSYGPDRAGILSHGSVLAGFSKFTDTSPTQRGIFIAERLRCNEIPAPPPTVDADNPPGNADDPNACKEERYGIHAEIASCAACHNLMDPIGMGLENYDIAGRFRETDDGKPDCEISGEGALPGVGSFSGPGALADRLVESGELERCATEQYLQFALGRDLEDDDPLLEHVAADFEATDYDFQQMISNLASDDAFGFRREPSN